MPKKKMKGTTVAKQQSKGEAKKQRRKEETPLSVAPPVVRTKKTRPELVLLSTNAPENNEVEKMDLAAAATADSFPEPNSEASVGEQDLRLHRGTSTMPDQPKSLQEVATNFADELRSLIEEATMRLIKTVVISIEGEANRRAYEQTRQRFRAMFEGAPNDFDISQFAPSPPQKALKGKGKGKAPKAKVKVKTPVKPKTRRGAKQSWTASCPVPNCTGTPIRPQRNFCSTHAKSLSAPEKERLRELQQIAAVKNAARLAE